MGDVDESRIPCSKDTRLLVQSLKRGGETYDSLLRKMARQYEPEKASTRNTAE